MSPVLAFGDDGSAEADECWSWVTSQHWEGWDLEIITAEPRKDMKPVEGRAELHPWEPESPRDPGAAGFNSVVHLHTEMDSREALIARPWDLVVIGPRGSGLLKRLHLGSTADWLLREPTSPLVIAHESGPVREVLFAADGSPHAQRALECLISMPWVTDTTVKVVVVDDGRIDVEDAGSKAETSLADADVQTERVNRTGKPAHEILDECKNSDPDLVVMGVRGHGGIKKLVVGSTTSAVVGTGETSVLVAHATDAD